MSQNHADEIEAGESAGSQVVLSGREHPHRAERRARQERIAAISGNNHIGLAGGGESRDAGALRSEAGR